MKKIILLFALVLTNVMYKAADAQVNVSVNIGSQPVWGPAGYDYAENYYFPDIDVYYNVPSRQFIYFDGRGWVSDYSLPAFCNGFDLYNSYKVVINEPQPYLRNNYWHSQYYGYRGRPQPNIYNSRDSRYYVIKEHPMHGNWMGGRPNNVYDNRGGNFSDRPGNFGRNDDRRFDNQRPDMGRNDNRRFDNQRPDMQRNNDRRFDNQRPDMQRNDNRRFDNNQGRQDMGRNDDRRGNNGFGGRRF